jgi:aldose 1-epimerase
MKTRKTSFGITPEKKEAFLYTLTNEMGLEIKATNYGGIITSIKCHDSKGKLGEVVLGFNSLENYITNNFYLGCIIGRYANRINKAFFSLDEKEYQLVKNDGTNHLHGGLNGFDKVLWKSEKGVTEDGAFLRLFYSSPDGEEGYPGNLKAQAKYTVTINNELKIDYEASTDKPTIVNLTNHSYFNLKGGGNILDHILTLNANEYTPIDKNLIPNGRIENVVGTPLDFTKPREIGNRIDDPHPQIQFGKGYDHNYVLRKEKEFSYAATLFEPVSRRTMDVYTSEPGIQFYSGNFLPDTHMKYYKRSGLCLETQHYPDSPNNPQFPSTRLDPGKKYKSRTVFKFGVK